MSTYTNPRVRKRNTHCNASDGEVRADPIKIAWVGGMMLLGTVGSALTMTTGAVLLFVAFTAIVLCFGHSLGMHRRLIHRSYECPQWLDYFLVHLGVIVGLAGPFGMVRTHDMRDWAQRQGQCHSYFAHDERWYRDFFWQNFCSIRLQNPPEFVIEQEIDNDRVYRFMERTWMLQQLPWALAFYALGGIGWVFWGICTRVTVSIVGHWLIGYFAHNAGDRDWHVDGAAVQGYNVPFAALLTMGESWHNNHHAFPGSAKLGLEPGQWDPGWWVLQGLSRLGLAWNFVTPALLPERSDLLPMSPLADRAPGAIAAPAGPCSRE